MTEKTKVNTEALAKVAFTAAEAGKAFRAFCNVLLALGYIKFRLKHKKKYCLRSAIGLKRR